MMIKRNLMETDILLLLPNKTYALRKQRVASFNMKRRLNGYSQELIKVAEQVHGTATLYKSDVCPLSKVWWKMPSQKSFARLPLPNQALPLLPAALPLYETLPTLYSTFEYNYPLSHWVYVL